MMADVPAHSRVLGGGRSRRGRLRRSRAGPVATRGRPIRPASDGDRTTLGRPSPEPYPAESHDRRTVPGPRPEGPLGLAEGRPRAVAHRGPVARQPLDDILPGGGTARPIRFKAVTAACRTSPSSSPSRSRRTVTFPGRADAAQRGRGLEANGRVGVLESGEEALAGLGRAAGPELTDGLGPHRGVAVVHGVEDGGRAATPPSMASRVQIACRRACRGASRRRGVSPTARTASGPAPRGGVAPPSSRSGPGGRGRGRVRPSTPGTPAPSPPGCTRPAWGGRTRPPVSQLEQAAGLDVAPPAGNCQSPT